MIDQKSINIIITEGIKEITGCEVVKSNLAGAPIPPYPYISFSILNTETRKGTYAGKGTRYLPLTQTWSFTVQGDDDDVTMITALKARDWLEEAGRLQLSDRGIIVQRVSAVQNRDTLLTVAYEYRKGFDVVLSLMNEVQVSETETIDNANIEEE